MKIVFYRNLVAKKIVRILFSKLLSVIVTIGICCLFQSCEPNYAPKPRGYFRIIYPDKEYRVFENEDCPYSFEYPVYASIAQTNRKNDFCWHNVNYPMFNATIHVSYYKYNTDSIYQKFVSDAHVFAFRHSLKATSIDERKIYSNAQRVYGLIYEIEGNAASWYQFYVTDSLKHYVRGALYFNEKPRQDSIQPVLDFIVDDIKMMIKTFKWKKNDTN